MFLILVDATNVSGEIKPANEAGSSFDSFDNGAFEIGGSISTSGRPRETSLLMSPLVVAGIVIGLVLVLSCVTIIAGSLKKDSRMRGSQLGMIPAQGEFSCFASILDLHNVLNVSSLLLNFKIMRTCVPTEDPPISFVNNPREEVVTLPEENSWLSRSAMTFLGKPHF
uniref:Uncharacterized protein n=1 Tax=Eptatretus burgeri TaxID=7764 RepID=A0A8C4NHA5_EPTBU